MRGAPWHYGMPMATVAPGRWPGSLWLVVVATVCAGFLACASRAEAYLYYSWRDASGQYAIGRANPDATGPVRYLIGPFTVPIGGVAVDRSYVYWASPGTQSIGRANLDGSAVNQRFITGVNALGLGVDTLDHYYKWRHIYWTDPDSNAIGRAVIDGTLVEPRFITGAADPQGIGVTGVWVFWRNSGSIGFFNGSVDYPIINQHLVSATPTQVGLAQLTVNHSFVYWGWSTFGCEIDEYCWNFARANLDGSNVLQPHDQAWGSIGKTGAMVADDNYLWYADAKRGFLQRLHSDLSSAAIGPNRFPGAWLAIDPPPTLAGGRGTARITNLSESARRWRAGEALPQYARKVVPVGTTFSFTLSKAAMVTFTFSQTRTGRRVGTLRHSGHRGRNRLRFAGRLNRGTLAPGTYALTVTSPRADTSSPPQRISFTIVRS
jgi:hypothetical protein